MSLFLFVSSACLLYPFPAWCLSSSISVLQPPLLYYGKGQWPIRCHSLLLFFFHILCSLLVSIFLAFRKKSPGHCKHKINSLSSLSFSFFHNLVTPLILLFRPSSPVFFCSKVMKTQTHTFSRYTLINKPWQGCVSRWQRWRGHGHRAVWGEALREVNHPDTWRRTGTVQVLPWWCGLVTTGQKMGNISWD